MTLTTKWLHKNKILKIYQNDYTFDYNSDINTAAKNEIPSTSEYLKSWLRCFLLDIDSSRNITNKKTFNNSKTIPNCLYCIKNKGIYICHNNRINLIINSEKIQSISKNQFMEKHWIYPEFPNMLEIRYTNGTSKNKSVERLFLFKDNEGLDLEKVVQMMKNLFEI